MCSPFGEWQTWDQAPSWSDAGFEESLDGGQAFRWQRCGDHFEGRWSGNVVRLKCEGNRTFYSLPKNADPAPTIAALEHYFALGTDFGALTDTLPWRSDPVLRSAIDHFQGLRILRQPFSETLFCFLCSSTKQIPQIKAICEKVAYSHGPGLADGSHGLPNWSTLAAAGEACLREAKLGYRARYIHQTAQFLKTHPSWLKITETAPIETARERLMQLPGVGRKIADCTLLFGAGRLDAFPIDTWVEKILTRAYILEGWQSKQLQDFARVHFGPAAGLAQQYLFAAARAGVIPA